MIDNSKSKADHRVFSNDVRTLKTELTFLLENAVSDITQHQVSNQATSVYAQNYCLNKDQRPSSYARYV